MPVKVWFQTSSTFPACITGVCTILSIYCVSVKYTHFERNGENESIKKLQNLKCVIFFLT